MRRPYVICHMMPALDGRIVTKRWNLTAAASSEYERTASSFGADGWIIGRVSMEPYAGKSRVPRGRAKTATARTDFVAEHDAQSYAIAIDPSGKLTWKSNEIDGEHVITILTESVSDDYLTFLQSKGVSYLFGGKEEIDLPRVLGKLASHFGIRKLLLEGGGRINGTFLEANVIDELSILIIPIADGSIGTPSLFDAAEGKGPVRNLRLLSIEKRKGDVVWLRYKVKKPRA